MACLSPKVQLAPRPVRNSNFYSAMHSFTSEGDDEGSFVSRLTSLIMNYVVMIFFETACIVQPQNAGSPD